MSFVNGTTLVLTLLASGPLSFIHTPVPSSSTVTEHAMQQGKVSVAVNKTKLSECVETKHFAPKKQTNTLR